MPAICARACLALVAVSSTGYGDEWSVVPSVQVRAQHDDNSNMSVSDPTSVWGASVSPLLDLRRRTAASTVGLGGRLIFNRYSEDSVRDTNIQLLTFNGRSNTRLSRFGLNGSYRRDTILTRVAEERDEDEDDEGTIDTGDVDIDLVRAEVRRNRLALTPSWTRTLTKTTSMRLGYTLNRTFYSDDAGTPLSDFRRHRVDASMLYSLSHRERLHVTASAGNYKALDRGTETDDYSLTTGLMSNFSPLLRGELTVGIRSSTTTNNGDEFDSTGSSLSASLVKKSSEVTTYRFVLGRNLYPSGAGTLVLSDYLRARYSHDMSPKLSLSVWANANRNRSPDLFSSTVDRTYYNVEPGFRYKLTRFWSIDGSYRYRWQEYKDADDSASSNAVFLAASYAWPRIAVSR